MSGTGTMYDKLSLINTALTRTGNNPVSFEGDGSPEWIIGSDAYETELPALIARGNWGFATEFRVLTRTGDSDDPRFEDRFAKPIGCLQILAVMTHGQTYDHTIPYDVIGNEIHCNANGQNPQAKFVGIPSADQWPPMFLEALRLKLMSQVYRGFNEDPTEADRTDMRAEGMIQQALARSSQEAPPKALLRSQLRASRYIRRGGWPFSNNSIIDR